MKEIIDNKEYNTYTAKYLGKLAGQFDPRKSGDDNELVLHLFRDDDLGYFLFVRGSDGIIWRQSLMYKRISPLSEDEATRMLDDFRAGDAAKKRAVLLAALSMHLRRTINRGRRPSDCYNVAPLSYDDALKLVAKM